MTREFIPVKNQKFEIGRTINPFACTCERCDFMHCPKKNYAVKMTPKKYKVEEFWDAYKDEILKINKPDKWQYNFHKEYKFVLTYSLLVEFIDSLFTFPKGLYWSPENSASFGEDIDNVVYKEIALQKLSRSGNIINLGTVYIDDGLLFDLDLNKSQYNVAKKIYTAIRWLKEKVFEYYQDKDAEWKIGWLSPEGRHYPCNHTEHSKLAYKLGYGEYGLESMGWVKVALEQEDGYFYNRRFLTAEQRNWLSLSGYTVDDWMFCENFA